MPLLLLTGFGPWPGVPFNPSWAAVEATRPNLPPCWRVERLWLPVSWHRAPLELCAALDQWRGDLGAVIACGVAPTTYWRPELVALNAHGPSRPDGDGICLAEGASVVPGAPAAYFSTLPVFGLRDRWRAAGWSAEVSREAGGYLCNTVAYVLAHHLAQLGLDHLPAGFIHCPPAGDAAEVEKLGHSQALALAAEIVTQMPEGRP